MKTVKIYGPFNGRRYSNPWIAKVINAKIDFSDKVGGYTGRYGAGEAGELYISNPVENQIYAFGQKDRRGGNTEINYAIFKNDSITEISKTDMIKYFEEEQ